MTIDDETPDVSHTQLRASIHDHGHPSRTRQGLPAAIPRAALSTGGMDQRQGSHPPSVAIELEDKQIGVGRVRRRDQRGGRDEDGKRRRGGLSHMASVAVDGRKAGARSTVHRSRPV